MSGIRHSLHSQYFTVKNLLTVNDGLIMRKRGKKAGKRSGSVLPSSCVCVCCMMYLCALFHVVNTKWKKRLSNNLKKQKNICIV